MSIQKYEEYKRLVVDTIAEANEMQVDDIKEEEVIECYRRGLSYIEAYNVIVWGIEPSKGKNCNYKS